MTILPTGPHVDTRCSLPREPRDDGAVLLVPATPPTPGARQNTALRITDLTDVRHRIRCHARLSFKRGDRGTAHERTKRNRPMSEAEDRHDERSKR